MPARSNQRPMLIWRKSTTSGSSGECVEIAARGWSVLVRDSRDRHGPMLTFDRSDWRVLLTRIKNGAHDTG
jgi:hypothetical protein